MADGVDIRTVQELLGHKDLRTTQIYTHVLNLNGYAVKSPADRFGHLTRPTGWQGRATEARTSGVTCTEPGAERHGRSVLKTGG